MIRSAVPLDDSRRTREKSLAVVTGTDSAESLNSLENRTQSTFQNVRWFAPEIHRWIRPASLKQRTVSFCNLFSPLSPEAPCVQAMVLYIIHIVKIY